jgi:hypothetical protein
VIKGYKQMDYGETYAPVGKLTTFRLLVGIAARNNWNIDHLDVVTAFLNPDVDDDSLLMQLPEGWPEGLMDECPEGEDSEVRVVRLRKALYGLKQAPHLWYRHINAFLLSLDFFQSEADPNLYIRNKGGILLLLYVDDMLLTYPPQAAKEAEEIKVALAATYKITNLGTARQFIEIEIHRNEDGTIGLGQRRFIDSVLNRFHMEHAYGAATSLDEKVMLDLIGGENKVDPREYQAIVGSLMYIALATRPDILFAVAALSRYNSKPFTSHLTAAKRVLRNLKATRDYQLHYDTHDRNLTGYTDSEWANNSADRKSQGGHTFISNGTISWQSRKQDIVAMSTLEAEYIASSEASREGRWLLQLCKDIKHNRNNKNNKNNKTKPLPILCDNEGPLAHITNRVIKSRTKHIDVCYHNSRDLHERGIVNYSWISTHENVADIFTKALERQKHDKFTKAMGLW